MTYRILVVAFILARVAVLQAISHTQTMDQDDAQMQLRLMMSAVSKPVRREHNAVIGSRQSRDFGVVVAQGRLVYEYALMMMSETSMNEVLRSENKLRLPRGFWPACCLHCFHRKCTDSLRKQLSKSLHHHINSLRKGATTLQGMLGDKESTQKRSKGCADNALKSPELGQLLYDWFIDCLQLFNCRVHQPMCMARAQYLKNRMLDEGYNPRLLPSLVSEAGKTWFRRWRERFEIVSRKTVKHLKVSWAKLKKRVRVYLKNVFALRFLWIKCHGPDKPMRWVSWDQKPAWFNNTALDSTYSVVGYEPLVREIEAHAKQRMTICTCVDSGNPLPPVGVLFKAEPNGRVWRELHEDTGIPAWMHVQTQCKGSYRASDMVDLLEKTLPPRGQDYESQVICLDWFAAHRDPAVAACIESRGHVLLLHGGGTTGYEQINDTHLHATLQARMKALEIAVFYGELQEMEAQGLTKACSHSRRDLCMLVKEIWESLDHSAISHKGYQQTGPLLPLDGPIYMRDLCRDLRDVVKDMCPHEDPEQVGTQIRKEAYDLVERMWGRQCNQWSDYHHVVEDHDDHKAQDEGEEAMPYEVEGDSGGEDDDADGNDEDGGNNDDDDGHDGGDSDGGGDDELETESEGDDLEDDGTQEEGDGIDNEGEVTPGSGGDVASGPALLGDQTPPMETQDPLLRRKSFRARLLDQAVAEGDDGSIRMLRRLLSSVDKNTRGRTTTQYSELADAIMTERRVSNTAKRARLREDREDLRQTADSQRLLATAKKEAQEAKQKAIADAAASMAAKRKIDREEVMAKMRSTRLQTLFPARHAASMGAFIKGMSAVEIANATTKMTRLHNQKRFDRWLTIDDPWTPNLTLLHFFGSLPDRDKKFNNAAKRQVRCSPELAAYIRGQTTYVDPVDGPCPNLALSMLLRHCFIRDNFMFVGPFTPYQLLCSSHMILDMAFIRAVLAASEWLGPDSYAGRLYSDMASTGSRGRAMSHTLPWPKYLSSCVSFIFSFLSCAL